MASRTTRSGVAVMPATRIVPAIAVPRLEPRLDTLRDRPEISPCWPSGKLDCTTLTDGVSITPRPSPMRSRPGANAQAVEEPVTKKIRTPMPAIVRMNPARMSVRCGTTLRKSLGRQRGDQTGRASQR